MSILQAAVRRLTVNHLDDGTSGDLDEKLSLEKPKSIVDLGELSRAFTAGMKQTKVAKVTNYYRLYYRSRMYVSKVSSDEHLFLPR